MNFLEELTLTEDGGVIKKVIQHGDKEPVEPEDGDEVGVDYEGRLEDGTIFDSSKREGREPIKFTLGQG